MTIPELYELYSEYPNVQTDTRKLAAGDLFFALRGPSFNGNEFAEHAINAGAAYAIIDDVQFQKSDRFIVVEDVLTTLQLLARHHRNQFNIPFIGVTGSNGKTTTKELIMSVLRTAYITYATSGNLNNHIGVPLTILGIKKDAEMAIIEMGANHLHEIESYCNIALPTHGLITNCGKAHIEGFGSEENIRKGKGELYDFLRLQSGTIFRNADLNYLEKMAHGTTNQVTYGSANAQYIGKPLTDDILLKLAVLNHTKEAFISTNLVGAYNFPNVMAAVAIGLHFGINIDKIKAAIEAYTPDNSRSQWVQKGSNQIVLDAYNANPSSMRAAILNFASMDVPDKILWLGGMKEMGKDEQREHAELIELIDQYSWKEVVLVGNEFKGLHKSYQWFATSVEAAKVLGENRLEHASILIKGSRGSRMEVLLDLL